MKRLRSGKKKMIEPDIDEESSSSESDESDVHRGKKKIRPRNVKKSSQTEDVDADEIQEILEQKRAAEQLPQHIVERLRELVINLRHKVPPQHDVERACGSHVPTAEERKTFEKLIRPNSIKKGVFTNEEDQRITNNWKAFCKAHYWKINDPRPFIYMRHSTGFFLAKQEERKKFVQFLADGLPFRTLYSVYHRFRNLYDSPKVRSRYKQEEDEYIIKHIEQNENVDETRKFADLAKVLDRTRASVWRRYRLLKKKQKQRELDD